MKTVEKQQTVSIAMLFLLGTVLMSCALFVAQAAPGGMHLPTRSTEMQCCTFQPLPDIHTTLQSVTITDSYRNFLVGFSVLLLSVYFSRTLRERTVAFGDFSKMRLLKLHRLRQPLSGFERLLQRGIIQPRLYEPATVLN